MATVDEVKKQVHETMLLFMKLHEEGDMQGLEQVYTSDCVLMPPDGSTLYGSEFKNFYCNSNVKRYVAEVDETLVEGDMAIAREHYTAYHADGTVVGKGNALSVWSKRDGQWKAKLVMWTDSV